MYDVRSIFYTCALSDDDGLGRHAYPNMLVLYNLLRTYLHCAEGTTMPTIDTNIK